MGADPGAPAPVGGSGDDAPGPQSSGPGLIDIAALKRRVLLTGLVALVLFFTAGYVVSAAGAADWWMLVVALLLWALVVRPMMRPVQDVTRLRRRLAYQAFLEGRERR